MSLSFGDILGGVSQFLNLFGAAKTAAQKASLQKQLISHLNATPQALAIPQPYQTLSSDLSNQANQLGASQKAAIQQQFQQSLAHSLGDLQQRGLGGSNLQANLTAGSQKQESQALSSVDENILAQKLGLQQNIGLQGLGESAGERGQLLGSQNSIYNSLVNPLFGGNSNPLSGFTGALNSLASGLGGSKSSTLTNAPAYTGAPPLQV
jgi:hypothetical protein